MRCSALSRSVDGWAAESANDSITTGVLPGLVEIGRRSGEDSHSQYTAVYGLALSPAVASVSAQVDGQTDQATFGADRSFRLAVTRLVRRRQ